MIKWCPKPYDIYYANIIRVLGCQYYWELEQKKRDDLELPRIDKHKWMKTMQVIVPHLKLMKGMRCAPLAYAVRQHVKVTHILPGYLAYPNLDKEMIARAPIVDAKSNLKMTQDSLDRAYVSWQCNTFKVVKALVYHILSKIFMDMDAYVYMRQRKSRLDFELCSLMTIIDFLALTMWPGRPQMQKKTAQLLLWWWKERMELIHVTFNKEQHTIMNQFADHSYSGIDDST